MAPRWTSSQFESSCPEETHEEGEAADKHVHGSEFVSADNKKSLLVLTAINGRNPKRLWVLAILFAIYGCFSALFLLGLVLLTVALERLVSRPGLRHLDDWVLITHIIGFAVGHWWQGRLVEGVGLMALFFGGFWLADAKK